MADLEQEYVIETEGSNRLPIGERGTGKVLAIVIAKSDDEAIVKYLAKHPEEEKTDVWGIEMSDWAFAGSFIEPDGENEPICSSCIEDDGGFMGSEEELADDKAGPCWRCIQVCRESVDEYIP